MTKQEKLDYVTKHFLKDAIQSIKDYGRYWSSNISRTMTTALCDKLKESGYDVIVSEVPPRWEHVFYLDATDFDKIKDIALQRDTDNKSNLPI